MAKKRLNATNLNKLRLNQKSLNRTIYVLNGDYELKVYDVFEEAKIDKVIYDYMKMFRDASQGLEIDDDFARGMGVIFFTLIVREFTDVNFIPQTTKVEEILPVAYELYSTGKTQESDLGLLMQIISQMKEDQLARVSSKFEASSIEVGRIMSEFSYKQAVSNSQRLNVLADPDAT